MSVEGCMEHLDKQQLPSLNSKEHMEGQRKSNKNKEKVPVQLTSLQHIELSCLTVHIKNRSLDSTHLQIHA